MTDKSGSLKFYKEKLNNLIDRYYEVDEVDEDLLINIEERAKNLAFSCSMERAKLFPESAV